MFKKITNMVLAGLLPLFLVACGGGGGGADAGGTGSTDADGTGSTDAGGGTGGVGFQSFSGVVSNNRVHGARLTICPINNSVKNKTACQTFYNITGVDGSYSITLHNFSADAVWMEAIGGTYVDEATGETVNLTTPLQAVSGLDGNSTSHTLHITTVTYIAATLLGSGMSVDAIDAVNAKVRNALFGENATVDIIQTEPIDIRNASTAGDQADYGLKLAILSQLRENRKADGTTETLDEMLQALANDLADNNQLDTNQNALAVATRQFIASPRNTTGLTADDTNLDTVHMGGGASAFAQANLTLTRSYAVNPGLLAQGVEVSNQQSANAVHYSLLSGQDTFSIDSKTGTVSLVNELSAEGTYITEVLATNSSGTQKYLLSLIVDNTKPTLAAHVNLPVLVNQQVHDENHSDTAPNLNSLASDMVTANANLEFKIANFASIDTGYGLSLGMDGPNSANYASTRPNGNDIHLHPVVGFTGTTRVQIQARDEAGNESDIVEFTLAVLSEAGDQDNDGLTNLEEKNYAFDPLSNSDGANGDADQDGLINVAEIRLGMNPNEMGDDLGNNTDTDKHMMHIINRLSYGATADLVAHVKNIGVDAWVEEQLAPEAIPAAGSFTEEENQAQFIRDNRQTAYDSNFIFKTSTDRYTALRPILTGKQLQVVMGKFWDNHFSTSLLSHMNPVAEMAEEDYFFENAFGNFRQLLGYSAKNYTMLYYLNGRSNTRDGPNEDYGREVMELHTLGVDGGYTENDVRQMSRIFTGWSIDNQPQASRYPLNNVFPTPDELVELFASVFNPDDHDDGLQDYDRDGLQGDKPLFTGTPQATVIVSKMGANGSQEIEEAMDALVSHPSTANFICTKLAKKFVADNPQDATINRCATTFTNNISSANQIELVLRSLITSTEFTHQSTIHTKVKDPEEYLVGLARMINLDVEEIFGRTASDNLPYGIGTRLAEINMQSYGYPAPTGWAEVSAAWLSSNQTLLRQRQGNNLLADHFDVRAYVNRHQLQTSRDIIRHFFLIMLSGQYTQADIKLAYEIFHPGNITFSLDDADAASRLRSFVMALVAHPNYQLH